MPTQERPKLITELKDKNGKIQAEMISIGSIPLDPLELNRAIWYLNRGGLSCSVHRYHGICWRCLRKKFYISRRDKWEGGDWDCYKQGWKAWRKLLRSGCKARELDLLLAHAIEYGVNWRGRHMWPNSRELKDLVDPLRSAPEKLRKIKEKVEVIFRSVWARTPFILRAGNSRDISEEATAFKAEILALESLAQRIEDAIPNLNPHKGKIDKYAIICLSRYVREKTGKRSDIMLERLLNAGMHWHAFKHSKREPSRLYTDEQIRSLIRHA
jgi:hypothetical protein